MARPSPINLRVHDFETAAEYISKYIRPRGGACLAMVAPDGMLQLVWNPTKEECTQMILRPACIGYYTRNSRIEIIEDDILTWLRNEPGSDQRAVA